MRRCARLLVLLTAFPALAQAVHRATPIDQLLKEIHEHGHLVSQMQPIEANDVTTAATKSFTVKAHRYSYDFSPSPFVVNQGDTVSLDITSTDTTHGFFLEQYVPLGVVITPGSHQKMTFVANTAGTFTYGCTVSSCGAGHATMQMAGVLTVQAAATPPSVTSFTPRSGSTSGGTVVAINGSAFQNGAAVKFGGAAAVSVTVNSSSSISAIAPAHAAGDVTLIVTNPDGQTATAGTYTYSAPGPVITSISPSSGTTAGGTAITISGSGFVTGAAVTIGGVSAQNVNVVNATTITAITPAGPFDITSTASRDVVVRLPDGSSATSAGGFVYSLPAPAIAFITPSDAPVAGGTTVSISGAGFTTALPTTITFGGVAGTDVQIAGPTTLTVTTPPHSAGAVPVVITVGSNSSMSSSVFTYESAPVTGKKRRAVKPH